MYWVYIVTNQQKTVLYTGVTNNLTRRLAEHKLAAHISQSNGFCGQYKAYHLLFAQEFEQVIDAIANEKRIKGWRRDKKNALINQQNPNWDFLEAAL
ncbi:MAG: GIY-YIG nuclease family protein [Pseudomonadales bacterium]|nr:GIY-YIG nuclease family protein [Pseudomonadales bacterium]